MRLQVNLGLSKLNVPAKVEYGKTTVTKMGASPFFLAPNPLPHPTLASTTAIITTLEAAFQSQQKGNTASTEALHNAETAFDNGFIELSHYVEDRANADTLNGSTIIAAANMKQKKAATRTKVAFKAAKGSVAGSVKLSIKAVKGAAYIVQQSPDHSVNAVGYTWTQSSISTKSRVELDGFATGSTMWFRYATVLSNVQSDWSDPVSIVIG